MKIITTAICTMLLLTGCQNETDPSADNLNSNVPNSLAARVSLAGQLPKQANAHAPELIPVSQAQRALTANEKVADNAQLKSWWHENGELNASTPVADANVRQSTFYDLDLVTVSKPNQSYKSFVYMTLPRGGRDKWLYTEDDGAEFADSANFTMSWSSFLYSEDTWVDVRLTGSNTLSSVDEVTIRPTTLGFEKQLIDNQTVRIKVPYSTDGYRFSVEFDFDLLTSYNDMSGATGQLTLTPGANAREVHTEPQNALLIYAEPMLNAQQQVDLIPDPQVDNIYTVPEGEVNNLNSITQDVIYFPAGTYFMPWNYHAYLPENVRWVYLEPGAYVKGAFQFRDAETDYKVTGFGVISGEKYVYEPDTNNGYMHTVAENCHGSCVKMLQFQSSSNTQNLTLHGVTLSEPPYHSFVVYGDESSFAMDVAQFKQIGSWYWQTDGLELYSGSTLKNTFYHSNDDVIKLYHSNVTAQNVQIWKVENGPVIQWGWAPRDIDNVTLSNVDIIHNRMYWADQKHNACVINSAKAWWDTGADNTADPSKTISNLSLNNIRSEGKTLCAMRLYALSNWQNININGLTIDELDPMPQSAHYSHFEALWNSDYSAQVSVSDNPNGLNIHNYIVDRQPVSKALNNWNADEIGRMNFSGELWDKWQTSTDQSATCLDSDLHINPVADQVYGSQLTLSASQNSGLPVNYYVDSGDASITGNNLTVGSQSGLVTVSAYQAGDSTYCSDFDSVTFSVAEPYWVGASWESFTLSQIPLNWDSSNNEYSAQVNLTTGNHALKFADTIDWSGDDWGNATGTSGTASLTTGGGNNIDFSIPVAGLYEIVFSPATLTYAIHYIDDPVAAPGSRWVGASWESWTLGNLPMTWDDYTAFYLDTWIEAGSYELKFSDTDNWSGDDWGNATGTSGIVSLTTGGGGNVSFSVSQSASYRIRLNPSTLEYSVTLNN